MAEPNLIIGNGKALTSNVARPGGGGPKKYPYEIEEARARLAPQLTSTIAALDALPAAAKPRGEGVALMTLHPAFLSKTYMPGAVLRRAGLQIVGSRATKIKPDKDLRVGVPAGPQPSAELYVSGTSDGFRELTRVLLSEATSDAAQRELRRFECVFRPMADTIPR